MVGSINVLYTTNRLKHRTFNSLAGEIAPGTKRDEMVQNLDFAETFLDVAGVPIPGDMQGESLMPLLLGDTAAWTRDAVYYHYYEYPGFHMVKRHYGIVTREFKLAHFYYDAG